MRPYLSEPAPGRGEDIKAGVATRRPAGVEGWRGAAAPAPRRAAPAEHGTFFLRVDGGDMGESGDH